MFSFFSPNFFDWVYLKILCDVENFEISLLQDKQNDRIAIVEIKNKNYSSDFLLIDSHNIKY